MVTQLQARRVEKGRASQVGESLVIEEPLQIRINGQAFSITMRTPGEDERLVRGLLFTEGIVRLDGLGAEIRLARLDGYTEADISVPEMYLCQDLLEKRTLIANASCGLCGQKSLDAVRTGDLPAVPERVLDGSLIPGLGRKMRDGQSGFEATGGSHAAAAFTIAGTLLGHFEDIGRHNAVDKVIGDLIWTDRLREAAILQVSGRISFEIVSKAAAAGITFLVAVSAASSLAVELARMVGMTLIAFSRDSRFTIYSHPGQVLLEGGEDD